MSINVWLIHHYLNYVVAGWFDRHDLPPEEAQDYLPYVCELKKAAIAHNDLHTVVVAFRHIRDNRDLDASAFGNTRYPYDDAEVRDIITFALDLLSPKAETADPGAREDTHFITTPFAEWQSSRKNQ